MTPNSEKITQEIGGFPKGKYSPKAGKRYFFDSKPEEEEVDRQKGCLLYPCPSLATVASASAKPEAATSARVASASIIRGAATSEAHEA